ncbi:type 1 glutamine amidotransferase domain-containing protein [Brevibacterium album]|uniref:type 1 glutamine amidotransferase domain-containing protein n=1 Tax=Brevibacterium album TaxID=417948 RepID=UPI00040BD229|nr:type 1 glutamine amidotransferase domain-containing protein [Brevibacterium album]
MSIADKRIAFLLTRGVEQIELTSPRQALEDAGAATTLISPSEGSLQAMEGDWEHAETFAVDAPVEGASATEYDALVLPGGTLNSDALRTDAEAVRLVREFFDQGKIVAAICHAPWILAEADVASGRRLTSVGSIRVDMVNAGAQWEDSEVVVDGNLITSRNPGDLEAFNREIIQALG